MGDGLLNAIEPHIERPAVRVPEVYHQLLVLGNGFDLECGLPSTYRDYFEPRFEAIRTQDWRGTGRLEGLGYDASPTIWDFLLRSKMYSPWYSVEGAIGDLVLSAGDGRRGAGGLASGLVERARDLVAIAGEEGGRDDRDAPARSDEDDVLNNAVEFMRFDLDAASREAARRWTALELIEYLGAQLGRFEANFGGYMRSISEHNDDYIERANELLEQMLADERPPGGRYVLGTTILSFNYTNPFKRSIEKSGATRIINVHGNLDEGIIFGIDGTECSDNPLAFPFSKTFRVITAGTDFGSGAIRTSGGDRLHRETSVIKFYGHSLGTADYAYFQALFDGVDLYASGTKLVFYFRPPRNRDGDRESEALARNTMAANVTRLLSEYGKTLDNEDHGRNLMHKLMIEGRLKVRLLEGA